MRPHDNCAYSNQSRRNRRLDQRVVEPGKAPQLPIGSQRVNPNDPLSDWIIPDCYVPGRADCQ